MELKRRRNGAGLVLAAICLVAIVALAGPGSTSANAVAAKPGTLVPDPQAGQALPTRRGRSLVDLHCRGADSCQGRLRVLPRGQRAHRLLGDDEIARRPVRVKADGPKSVLLSGSARDALRHTGVLKVTVELKSNGRPLKLSRAISSPSGNVGHSKPNRVRVRNLPGDDTVKTYSWSWNIAAHSFKALPDFHCPDDAENVLSNGREIQTKKSHERIGLQAGLDVKASDGTGYAGFDVPHLKFHQGSRGNYPDYEAMTGWPEGGWTYNSVWAPVFSSGHFELTMKCTSSQDHNTIAYKDKEVHPAYLFPWQN